jgi:hypothetical protein
LFDNFSYRTTLLLFAAAILATSDEGVFLLDFSPVCAGDDFISF